MRHIKTLGRTFTIRSALRTFIYVVNRILLLLAGYDFFFLHISLLFPFIHMFFAGALRVHGRPGLPAEERSHQPQPRSGDQGRAPPPVHRLLPVAAREVTFSRGRHPAGEPLTTGIGFISAQKGP